MQSSKAQTPLKDIALSPTAFETTAPYILALRVIKQREHTCMSLRMIREQTGPHILSFWVFLGKESKAGRKTIVVVPSHFGEMSERVVDEEGRKKVGGRDGFIYVHPGSTAAGNMG
jgi:hypothetical protein